MPVWESPSVQICKRILSKAWNTHLSSMKYRILRDATAIASGFLVAETGLRLFTEPVEPSTAHHRLFCQFDPQLGWAKIPNGCGFHVTPEYQVFERMNSCGLRGQEQSYSKLPGEHRILFLGDSYAEGYSVHQHQLFSSRLELKLNHNESSRRYSCINAGTGGYSTDQEWLFFCTEGKRYEPDLTVLMFYENDVLDNIAKVTHRGAEKPLFRVVNGYPEATNLPLPMPTSRAKVEAPSALAMRMLQKAFLLGHATIFLQQISRVTEVIQRIIASRRSGYTIPPDLWIWAEEAPERVEEAWHLTRVLLRAMRQSVKEAGSRFLVFLVPPQASIYPEVWRILQKKWGISGSGWDIHAVSRRMEKLCQEESIAFMDPTEAMHAQAARLRRCGKRLYYPIDGHWTSEGHELVACILDERLPRFDS